MKMVEENIYKLKKLLSELRSIKGRHTELVTVYIPAGAAIFDTINQLRNEQGTAENIKSKSTRKNVVDALEKILQHLKLYKQTPANGLAIFAGNVSETEGQTDLRIWAVEPPEQLKAKRYWCDQKFMLEPLEEMVAEKELFGLVVLDTKEATIGLLKGKKIEILRKMDSLVFGKFGKGGQSQQRFERVREGMINDWFKEIAENIKGLLPAEIKGIILGGPGPAKHDFYDGNYLQHDIKLRILGIKNVGYTDDHGLEELVERSEDLLAEAAVSKEKALVQRFFESLQKGNGMVTYGLENVRGALEAGAVDMILISDGIEEKTIDELKELAKNYGTALEIVSRDTREGEQLFQLNGIGAFLRWRLQ
jgi:peptide chain release factor subunit 1